MQGEYNGKPIFSRRYVSMNEDAIREEIDRLQDEIFSMQEALTLFGKDNKATRQHVIDSQAENEKLLRQLELKIQDLSDSLDYTKPFKSQLVDATSEFKNRLEGLYDEANKKNNSTFRAITALSFVNTILLFILIALVGYLVLFK